MRPSQLARIEKSLQVTLPRAYKSVVLGFPVAALAGNSDTYFWDDAEALLELNLALRKPGAFGLESWAPHLFAISASYEDGQARNITAIDLRDEQAPVWGFGAGIYAHVPPGKLEADFASFASKYVAFAPQLLKERSRGATLASRGHLIGGMVFLATGIGILWVYFSGFPIEPRAARWALVPLGLLGAVPGIYFLFAFAWPFFAGGKKPPASALSLMISVMLTCMGVLLTWAASEAWGAAQPGPRFSGGLTGTIYEHRIVWTLAAAVVDGIALLAWLGLLFGRKRHG